MLFANGLQLGYRHESDYDMLNTCEDEAQAPERFVYVTLPLPPALTKGKTSIDLKIQSLGPIWFYGENFGRYQKDLTQPTRGIYQASTHTTPRFVPAATEKQGKAPEAKPRPSAGPEVITKTKENVISRLKGMLANKGIPGNHKSRSSDLLVLSEAYQTDWTPAHKDRRAIDRIVRIGDAMAEDFAKDRKFIDADWSGTGALGWAGHCAFRRSVPNAVGVFGGCVIGATAALGCVFAAAFSGLTSDVPMHGAQGAVSACAPMLKYSVDYWRTHRRPYTNQSMIVDAGIYAANRALALIDPGSGIPEARALDFLHQSTGAKPWLGSDTANGGSEAPYGGN